jgi:hypothetical protein
MRGKRRAIFAVIRAFDEVIAGIAMPTAMQSPPASAHSAILASAFQCRTAPRSRVVDM